MASPNPANLDDSIENLQRFNALMADTVAQLQADQQTLESHAAAFDGLEDQGGDQLGALGDALESHLASLDAAAGDSTAALEALEESASAAADTRLSAAEDALERRGEAIEGDLSAAASDLESLANDLGDAGFAVAVDALTDAASAAADEQSEFEQAIGGLQALVQAATDTVRTAGDDVGSSIGEVVVEAKSQQGAALAVGELAAYAVQTFGPELLAAGESLEKVIDEAYAEAAETLLAGAAEDTSGVVDLLGQAAQRLESETLQGLEDAVAQTAGTSIQKLLEELDQAEALLAPGADTVDAAGALIPDLATAQSVIADIDRLLDTVES
jgi:hypothetical protein